MGANKNAKEAWFRQALRAHKGCAIEPDRNTGDQFLKNRGSQLRANHPLRAALQA